MLSWSVTSAKKVASTFYKNLSFQLLRSVIENTHTHVDMYKAYKTTCLWPLWPERKNRQFKSI